MTDEIHCPDCRFPEAPDQVGCAKPDCACHRPFGINLGDEVKATARFGG